MNYLVPPVNTKGLFKFSAPYDTLLKPDIEYRVTSVRELLELKNSEEKPFDTIYTAVGLTEVDFDNDLKNNIPIIVLVTNGGEYVYVPANRITSMPDITGVKYQDIILAISLGPVPLSMDKTVVKGLISDTVYDTLGIRSDIKEIPASAVILKTQAEDDSFKALLNNRATVDKSYRTRYLEAVQTITKKDERILALEEYIKTKL